MAKYHKYIFDTDKRKFIGDFETMYRNEAEENFDSWHQEDTRQFHRNVIKLLLSDYNFDRIIDFGCGKGAFTHTLKKSNNNVIGVDISPTAVKIAAEKFPDLRFLACDINHNEALKEFFKKNTSTDLIILMEILSYCDNWKEILTTCAQNSNYIMVSSFIPIDPIGYIKTKEEFLKVLESNFETIEVVQLSKVPFTIFFGTRKK